MLSYLQTPAAPALFKSMHIMQFKGMIGKEDEEEEEPSKKPNKRPEDRVYFALG